VLLDVSFCALLAVVTVTDLERRVIPNRALAVAAVAAIAIVAVGDPAALPERLIAAFAGGGSLLMLALARPHGLGMGDAKLVATMGLFLGRTSVVAVLVAFAGGALAGAMLIVRDGAAARTRSLPFAPFLAAGGLVGLCAGGEILHWYAASMIGR